MAVTITLSDFTRTVFGNKRIVIATATFSGSTYTSGGESLTPANFGLQGVDYVKAENATLLYKYDYTNKKLIAYTSAGGGATTTFTEAIGSTPTGTIKVMAIGYGLS